MIRLNSAIEYWGEPDEQRLGEMRDNGLTMGVSSGVWNILHSKPLLDLRDPAELEGDGRSFSRKQVLAEVTRAYEQRVMNNVHRSDYVEAIVGVALADYGWTRKAPWEGSGLRARIGCPARGQAIGGGTAMDTSQRQEAQLEPVVAYYQDESQDLDKVLDIFIRTIRCQPSPKT